MKRTISIVMVMVMIFAVAIPVMANPNQNPNQNPGSPSASSSGVTVTVTGGGNNLVINAICNSTGDVLVIPREGNGTFSQTFNAFDHQVTIQVQGNSLRSASAVPTGFIPCTCPPPCRCFGSCLC